MTNLGLTKYFPLTSLRLVISACAALFACKPGGETPDVVVSSVAFDASSDLRALLVSETNNCLYVANYSNNRIHCVDLTTHSINSDAALKTAFKPVAMATASDGAVVVVASTDPSTAAAVEVFFSPNTPAPVCKLSGTPTSVIVTDKNQIYVGVSVPPGSIYSCGTVSALSQYATLVTSFDSYRIAGINNGGTLMFTVSYATNLVTLWDTQAEPPNNISTQNLFGASVKYGWVVFHPNDREAYVVTNGTATDGMFLPTYSVGHTRTTMTSITSPLHPTFVPNALAFLEPLHRAVMTHASTPLSWSTQHKSELTDLHIFDTDTGDEVAHYDVGDHVRENGLAVDQHNAIYMLLGETQATRVGIVTPP